MKEVKKSSRVTQQKTCRKIQNLLQDPFTCPHVNNTERQPRPWKDTEEETKIVACLKFAKGPRGRDAALEGRNA